VSILVVPRSLSDYATVAAEVQRWLELRRPLGTQHRVAGPTWVPIDGELLVAQRSDAAPALGQAVLDDIEAFLHPLTGGEDGRGWPFGRSVYASEIAARLERLPGVDYVPEVALSTDGATTAAEPLWSDRGKPYGVGLRGHHLPQAKVDPAKVVVSAGFVRVDVTVTFPADTPDLTDARRTAYAAVRQFFHPLHDWPPSGSAPWTVAETRVAEIVSDATGLDDTVTFAAEGSRLAHDNAGVGQLELRAGEIADLRVEVVRA
jgi:hypothetical protein